jgi:transcriptional regulator with XRE-family HTH domain
MQNNNRTYLKVKELLEGEVARRGSKREAARRIGIDATSLDYYIDGIREPGQKQLERMAAYFSVTVAYLRGESESDRPTVVSVVASSDTRDKLLWDMWSQLSDEQKNKHLKAIIDDLPPSQPDSAEE